MKKKLISTIAAVLVVALMVPMALGVGLQEIFGLLSGSSFSSYITFYNARNEETALFVKKEVQNAGNDVLPEDDEFEFTLRINGELAKKLQYTLYDAEGRRIYNYESGQTTVEDKTKLETPIKTDNHGMFSLKAGQTAKFDGLLPGDTYEVEESENPPYIQTNPPQGESAQGTLTNDGDQVTFVNLYPRTESGRLEVRKSVSYPDKYDVPETPEFTFEIKISNKAYKNQAFVVKDLDTNDKVSEGTTDANGRFMLNGNTYAVFSDVPVDADFSVKEILEDAVREAGWRVVGEDEQEGATSTNGNVVSFANVLASFGVSKEMLGGVAVEESFGFQVLDGKNKPWNGSLSYYLYDAGKHLVDEELHTTGTDGTFSLKATQTAIFVGMEAGTAYGVREVSTGRYVQYLPGDGSGYTQKVVSDSVEVLPFVNADVPSPTLLTVKKTLTDNSEDGSAPDVEFTFRISKKTGENTYEPIPRAAYDIIDKNGTRTLSADKNGCFTLHAWETARFVELDKNNTYMVEEVTDLLPEGFTLGGDAQAEALMEDDPIAFEFENNYDVPKDPHVGIRKEKANGDLLAGAVLQLIRKGENNEVEVLHEWVSANTEETFIVKVPGTYYIHEKEAPEGFVVAEDVEIEVKKTELKPDGTPVIQTFTMVNHRDQEVPTGVEALKAPTVRTIMVLVIAAGALIAAYFGISHKRKKNKD